MVSNGKAFPLLLLLLHHHHHHHHHHHFYYHYHHHHQVTEVGYKGLPLILNLTDITFKGKLRVELCPLVPIIPLFGVLVCTFLEEPHVDFSFKVARLDVMVRSSGSSGSGGGGGWGMTGMTGGRGSSISNSSSSSSSSSSSRRRRRRRRRGRMNSMSGS